MSENQDTSILLADEPILYKIMFIRGERVMVDTDLAQLYGVTTKRLNEQRRRNSKRFPKHFMFELTKDEKTELVAKCDRLQKLKHSSVLPNVFTLYGVLQAANVLNSDKAIEMGIRIIEVFVKMHEMVSTHKEILQKLEQIIAKDSEQDKKLSLLFDYLNQFEDAKRRDIEYSERTPIGYKTPN